jgi:xanthine dehydrogenase accessory factor
MAFHDVLFGDSVGVDGVFAARADNGMRILKVLGHGDGIAVTRLGLPDVLGIRPVDLLVDARMQKHRVTPDLRRLAHLTIGLGPGFSVDSNCDIAVETRPPKNGAIVRRGKTDAADGVASRLGNLGSERFVYSSSPGRWHTRVQIGASISKDSVLGFLDAVPVKAPLDGSVRGIVRDGTDVPSGVKLLEVDPRGRDAQWTGIDDRGRTIAKATLNAIRVHATRTAITWAAAASYPM